jgi:PAS domain S-box-containing protein
MRNDRKRGVKHRPWKTQDNPRPPLGTESKEAARGAELSTAPLLQVVLDSLAHPLYVIDVADYRVHLMNRAAREAYRNEAATCYALTHHRDAPCHSEEHPCSIEIIKETGEPTVVEHIHYDSDGTARNVEVHAFPIFNEAGVLVQIIEYNVDITARKRAEETLRQAEQRFRTIFDTTSDGIFLHDLETRKVMMCNKSFREMMGYTEQESAQLSVANLHPPADLPFIYAQIERFLAGARPLRHDIRFQRKDGSILVADVTPDLVQLDGKRYVMVALKDITERKRMEEELQHHAEHLEELVGERTGELLHRTRQLQKLTLEMSEAEDRERDRLAQILHDDLQQELAAAKFHLSVARGRVKCDPSLQEIITTVDQMLKDAINESRRLSHELSPAVLRRSDLAEILRWLANEMRAKHGLTVRVQGRAHLQSDAIKAFLYRTAQELLFNTVKHAQVNEAKVRVRPWGGYIYLSVSDRGRGFDPGTLGEATGFGLLSIRERIELLGGRMEIRSAPGQGSTFFVIVPTSAAAAPLSGRAEGAERSTAQDDGRLRVVLADDHDIVRQGLAALLSEEDAMTIVGEATNGREAVELAERLHPDVVIMDVSMPVMSGEEATRRIKQELPQTRIVSLSVREEPEVREKMREAGAESYVLKTAPYKELLAAIRGNEREA